MKLPPWLDAHAPPRATPERQDMSAARNVMAAVPVRGKPSDAQDWLEWADQFERRVLARLSKRVKYLQRGFTAPALAAPLLLRPAEKRYWLFLQNTAAAGQIVISFGMPPTGNNLTLNPLGLFEPEWVTQDEIWVAGIPAGTIGIVMVATVLED